jgi:putative transposase
MPRKPIERSNSHYYHITGRANNKEFFFLPIEDIWQIMVKTLSELQLEYDLKIPAFVLMNNHFHLLILTPDEDIDRVMYFFMKRVTLRIQKKSGRINKIFGGRYKGSLIKDESYLMNVYKYIYRNPVASQICMSAENYPYSSLHYLINSKLLKPFKIETLFEEKISETLKWIDEKFEEHEGASIKGGLKKTVFSYKKMNSTGRPIVPLF